MSASPFKVMPLPKVAPQRKGTGKDERLTKKVMGQFATTNQVDSSQKAPLPLRHGAGKGLMTAQGLIASIPVQRLMSHKKYAIEMVHSIVKDTNMDECGKHGTGDLEEVFLIW